MLCTNLLTKFIRHKFAASNILSTIYRRLIHTAIIRFGTLPSCAKTSSRLIVSSLPTTSLNRVGRYFSTLKTDCPYRLKRYPFTEICQNIHRFAKSGLQTKLNINKSKFAKINRHANQLIFLENW